MVHTAQVWTVCNTYNYNIITAAEGAAAEGAAVAAGTPPGRMLNLHGMELSRARCAIFAGGCASIWACARPTTSQSSAGKLGGGNFYPTLSSGRFTSSSGCAGWDDNNRFERNEHGEYEPATVTI